MCLFNMTTNMYNFLDYIRHTCSLRIHELDIVQHTSNSLIGCPAYCYCYCYFIWWSPFIPSRNLDEVFTYNHIWL